jgi:uncharacterized membrane protein
VLALGIGFFFVLATNRGWIGPEARVALGASASALAFGAGLLLRARFGQYWSALAAVGAGIAGAYATLAASAALYDFVPDWLALPLAAVIAGTGTAVALWWDSQLIAGLGLLGAALAPGLQALDSDLTWESAAFAVVVLVAGGVVTVPRGWRELLVSLSVVVGAQVEWLVATASGSDAGAVAVAAAASFALLGIAVGRQLVVGRTEIDPLALGYALAALGVTLIFAFQLLDDRSDRGTALLVAGGVWALVVALVHWQRLPDLGLAVGASALALAAVGTADLLAGAGLTIAWAAEALVLGVVARKLADARLQAMGIAYVVLAAASALVSDGRIDLLFDRDADHLGGVLPLAAAAAGAFGSAWLVPAELRARTESGLLAFVADVRRALARYRRGIQEALVFAGAALATLSAAFALVAGSFEWGHVAANALAATVGAVLAAAGARLRSDSLVAASSTWLALVLLESVAFDLSELDAGNGSRGGWSVLASSAGILAASYAVRFLQPERVLLDRLCGVGVGISYATAMLGVAWVEPERVPVGIGWLGVAGVYALLSAVVFRTSWGRVFSAILWVPALAALVGSEALLIEDGGARTMVVAITALAVGSLASAVREPWLWLAGVVLAVGVTALALVFQIQPWLDEDDLSRDLVLVSAVCALACFALAGLRWRDAALRDPTTVVWATGIVALLATERLAVGGWAATAFVVALTSGAIALLARPLREPRLWGAAVVVAGATTVATLVELTPLEQFFVASESPAADVWALFGCVAAVVALVVTARSRLDAGVLAAVAGALALYGVSLLILEVAERVSGASVETDFERGHTAVSALWALLGLALLVAGLLRGSKPVRWGGLALFGLSLAKLFLYDLAELSSVARAFSFILVGALLLAGGFFLQRLSDRLGPRDESP